MVDSGYVNIPTSVQDSNYRYKMPSIQLKVEGKGNGIKTNIVNLHLVAQALRVPTEYPLKFMAVQFGSQYKYKENGTEILCHLHGSLQYEDVKKQLDNFISKYILCPQCTYPEMVLRMKNGKVCGKCDSCGQRSLLDNAHKLANFIVQHPPKKVGIDENEEKEEKQEKKKEKAEKEKSEKIKSKGEKTKKDKKEKSSKNEIKEEDLTSEVVSDLIVQLKTIYFEQFADDKKSFTSESQATVTIYTKIKGFNISKNLGDRIFSILFKGIFTTNIYHQLKINKVILKQIYKKFKADFSLENSILANTVAFVNEYWSQEQIKEYFSTLVYELLQLELVKYDNLMEFGNNYQKVFKDHWLYNEDSFTNCHVGFQQMFDWLKQTEVQTN